MRQTTLAAEFSQLEAFADQPKEHVEWLASQAEDLHLNPGDVLFREGDPAVSFMIFLEGEVQFRRDSAGPDSPVYLTEPGEIGGVLPLSRMTHYGGSGRAVQPARVAVMPTTIFPEMLSRMPDLQRRLAGIMADRIREVAGIERQREKILALGKLSAGLAHELNNPAAAAQRALRGLGETLTSLQDATIELSRHCFASGEWESLLMFVRGVLQKRSSSPAPMGIAQAEQEDRLVAWLTRRGVPDAWQHASMLVECRLTEECLEEMASSVRGDCFVAAISYVCASVTADQLLRTASTSAERISQLVQNVKDYSFMDQAPVQDVDIHRGLDSTLNMFAHRLTDGIQVRRLYDPQLPLIPAHGSELNQVWTNLIDNALDAMNGSGELRLRTSVELDRVLVEISDTGPGIPPELQSRIFEPFFTTKKLGQGTGLGLDAVVQILRKHHGAVQLDSKPGNTRFQVRLPITQSTSAL